MWRYYPDSSSTITAFHLVFNVVLTVACIGLLGPTRLLLTRMLPEKIRQGTEVARPLFLDNDALDTPYLALSNAAREILRMGDLVDTLLRLLPETLDHRDKAATEQASRIGRELNILHKAVKAYLARLEKVDLTERDVIRLSDLIEFAINLGYAGDILERDIVQIGARRNNATVGVDHDILMQIHTRVLADLRLALSTMMTEDQRSARELIDAKRRLNEIERSASRDHLMRLGGADTSALSGSAMFLSILRDLKQVNSHFARIAYAVLTPQNAS
jgi:phosphate:Na+ symporter